MVVRTTVVATIVAAALSFPMAGVAAAQNNLDCDDFTSVAAAQSVLAGNTTDPNDLDTDNDGQACETLSNGRYEDNTFRPTTPTRGVETGAGGTADLVTAAEDIPDDSSGPLVPLSIIGGAVLAAGGGLVLFRRRSVRRND
jgi:hypothetical protein